MSIELINKYVEPAISCFTFDNEQNQQCDLSGLVLPIIGSVALILATTYCLKKRREIKEREFEKLKDEFYLSSTEFKTKDLEGLIQRGISVNHRFYKRETALHRAASHFNSDSVKELIRLNAEIDLKNDNGNTPLQLAAKNATIYSVRKLIKSGANKDIVDSEGNTLLHLVAMSESASQWAAQIRIECFKFLALSGVDTKAKNKLDKTPWEIAKESDWAKGCLNRVEEILDFKIPGLGQREFEELRDEFYQASKEKWKDLEGIIQRGMPVDYRFYGYGEYKKKLNGQTALHIAARSFNSWGIKELIRLGANFEEKDDDGNTPLQLAAKNAGSGGYTVPELIESGANKDIVDSEGNTLLHLAAMSDNYSSSESHIKLLKLLVNYGVDKEARNSSGKIPWEIAQDSDRLWKSWHWAKDCLTEVEEILGSDFKDLPID